MSVMFRIMAVVCFGIAIIKCQNMHEAMQFMICGFTLLILAKVEES